MIAESVVVIGASAGGVEALITLVGGLPPAFPAAICVVLHMPPQSDSHLAAILERSGSLPAMQAEDGAPLRPGQIYVAPPDYHLLVRPGRLGLDHGARENRSRPAVDPLFRSAARAYGARTVAVVLSGALDDGATGLLSVRARGGRIVVQDPAEAVYPSMPETALRTIRPDHILPAAAIGPLLADLIRQFPAAEGGVTMTSNGDAKDTPGDDLVAHDLTAQSQGARPDEPSVYSCPECGGVMWQVGTDTETVFRCHTGHVYSPLALLTQQSEDLEAALWRCVRMLTEKATLTRQLAAQERGRGNDASAARIEEQVSLDERHIRVLRDQLLGDLPGPLAQTRAVVTSLDEG